MPPPSVRALPHLRRCAYITARTVTGTHLRRLELPPVQFGTHRSGCHTARWFCSGEKSGSSSNRERTSQPVTGVSATEQPSKSKKIPEEAPADARVASTGTGTETDSAADSAADTQRTESSKSQKPEPATGSQQQPSSLEALLAAQTEQLERVRQLARNSLQFSSRLLGVGIFAAIVIPGYLIINWGMVRTGVSRESAEVISETIRDERIQFSAQEFSKALLNQLLTDEELANLVAKWVYQVLVSMQTEIGGLFVRILQQEQVVEGVNRLADRLVAYLCSSASVQEQVGRLLVYAICLPDSRDAAAKWAYELVMREDVTYGFRDLVVAALQTDAVVREAQALARQVLQDPDLVAEAKRAIAETLRDSEVRATAKESLWHIVSPWRGSRSVDNKKSSKLLDELIAADSLTQEERQVLRGLQARLRSGTAPAAAAPAAAASAAPAAAGASSQAAEVTGPPVAATPPPTAAPSPESLTAQAPPAAEPETVPVPEPAPAPEPAPEPVPEPVPVPVAEPVPTPAREPAPASVPEPPTRPEAETTPTAPGAPVVASPARDPPLPMPPSSPDILESTQETLEVQDPGSDRDANADSEQDPADPSRGKDFQETAPLVVQKRPLKKDEEGEADDGPFDRPDLF